MEQENKYQMIYGLKELFPEIYTQDIIDVLLKSEDKLYIGNSIRLLSLCMTDEKINEAIVSENNEMISELYTNKLSYVATDSATLLNEAKKTHEKEKRLLDQLQSVQDVLAKKNVTLSQDEKDKKIEELEHQLRAEQKMKKRIQEDLAAEAAKEKIFTNEEMTNMIRQAKDEAYRKGRLSAQKTQSENKGLRLSNIFKGKNNEWNQFLNQVMLNKELSEEQKNALLSLYMEGCPIHILKQIAKPNLSVLQMQYMASCYDN